MTYESKAMGCFFLAFISVFYIVGFGLLGYGLWAAMRSTQARNWPTTPGTLAAIEIKKHSDGEGTTWGVEVAYTYTVSQNVYTGTRLAFGYVRSSGREIHEEIYQKLKAANSVTVRYDPDDPASSVLSFGVHRSIRFILAFAITWLAFVAGFTLAWWVASQRDWVLLHNLSVQ